MGPPIGLGGNNVAQESDQEIQYLTKIFREGFKSIRLLKNSKNDLENVVRFLVSMTKWLEEKHRSGATILSLSKNQIDLLENYTKALLDESMIREMGTSRLQKKMTNLHAEERMLVENFNNLLKEYIKFDTMIEFNFRRCRAARANEVAYSLQSTCNSRKLQSLKDAMHDQFHEESRINNMLGHAATQLAYTHQDHDLAHFSASVAKKIFLKELKNFSITEKSLSSSWEKVHALRDSNKKKLIQFLMLSNMLCQIDHENEYIFQLLQNMEWNDQYNEKSIMLLGKISGCCDRIRTPFSTGKKHGLRDSQLGRIQYLLGEIRAGLTRGDIVEACFTHKRLHRTLELAEILCSLVQENQNNVEKSNSKRQQLVDVLEALGTKEAECNTAKRKSNHLNYELDKYQIETVNEAERILSLAQATFTTQENNEKQMSMLQKEVNQVENDIESLRKEKTSAEKSLRDARKGLTSLKTRVKRQERIPQDPTHKRVSEDTCKDKTKKRSHFGQTSRKKTFLESRAYCMCALALDEATC